MKRKKHTEFNVALPQSINSEHQEVLVFHGDVRDNKEPSFEACAQPSLDR